MTDREKVIKALECCKRKDGNECKVCPYTESDFCVEDMVTDALALLKEQEAVVRCKDCRWFVDGICDKYGFAHPQDWFCEDGDRRME